LLVHYYDGVNYAQLPRQVQVDKKCLFMTIIKQQDKTVHK